MTTNFKERAANLLANAQKQNNISQYSSSYSQGKHFHQQNDPYFNRATQLFQKINDLHINVDEGKQNKFKTLESILLNFEENINKIQNSKKQKLEYIGEKMISIQKQLQEENKNRNQLYETLEIAMASAERNLTKVIDQYQKERLDIDQKNLQKITLQIENLQEDVQREYILKSTSHPFLQKYLEVDLPLLKEQINNESALRQNYENKIFEQFVQNIDELRKYLAEEKKQQEIQEQELKKVLKSIGDKIRDQLLKSKQEREQNEEILINLVEQVIEKLKLEMVEYEI